MADPGLTSPSNTPLRSPNAPLTVSFPFLRERSGLWDEKKDKPLPRELPSPLPTKRTRTYSATVRAHSGPVFKGVCKNFSRSQGHGFLKPSHGGEDIFVHISDIEGEYVPTEGDEVTYKICRVPPKKLKSAGCGSQDHPSQPRNKTRDLVWTDHQLVDLKDWYTSSYLSL